MRSFAELEYDVRDGAAWITFNRPEALNAFSSTLYGELRTAVRTAEHDDDVDIIVITGRGRAFATGGDMKEVLATLDDPDPIAFYKFVDNLPFDAVRNCPKVVVAAINGICVGGGLITAMSADIAVAVESSQLGIPEGRFGLPEPWSPDLLIGRISTSALKYLALTGKLISASEAERLGMIYRAVPDAELEATVKEILSDVRHTTVNARAQYKEFINRRIAVTPLAAAEAVMMGPDARAGLRRFADRAAPRDG